MPIWLLRRARIRLLCASAGRILGDDCYIESPVEHVVNIEDKFREAEAERDAAIAKAKRAEEALRDIKIVARTPEEADSPDKAFDLILRIADEVLSSPPADATKMGSERERRLMDVVSHLAAGDDTICTKCGWIGMEDESFEEMPSGTGLSLLRPWVCPKCGGSVEVGADEVCKIALAALSPEPWGGTEGEEE